MAHVQFCHPWINLWPLLTVLPLAHFCVSFHRLRLLRVSLVLLALVTDGFRAPFRVSVRPYSQQSAASVAEPACVVPGRAAGDHRDLWSCRERSIRTATQASFHLLPFSRGRGDGTSEYPVHINTLIAAGRAPRHIETKHSVRRSCLACLREIAAVNIRAHFD